MGGGGGEGSVCFRLPCHHLPYSVLFDHHVAGLCSQEYQTDIKIPCAYVDNNLKFAILLEPFFSDKNITNVSVANGSWWTAAGSHKTPRLANARIHQTRCWLCYVGNNLFHARCGTEVENMPNAHFNPWKCQWHFSQLYSGAASERAVEQLVYRENEDRRNSLLAMALVTFPMNLKRHDEDKRLVTDSLFLLNIMIMTHTPAENTTRQ